jgi:hypothetical protein
MPIPGMPTGWVSGSGTRPRPVEPGLDSNQCLPVRLDGRWRSGWSAFGPIMEGMAQGWVAAGSAWRLTAGVWQHGSVGLATAGAGATARAVASTRVSMGIPFGKRAPSGIRKAAWTGSWSRTKSAPAAPSGQRRTCCGKVGRLPLASRPSSWAGSAGSREALDDDRGCRSSRGGFGAGGVASSSKPMLTLPRRPASTSGCALRCL